MIIITVSQANMYIRDQQVAVSGPANGRRVLKWARLGKKKWKTINTASQSGPTKQRRSFQTGELKNNNALDLGGNKCKCARPTDPRMKALIKIINQALELSFKIPSLFLFPFCLFHCSNLQLVGCVTLNVYI